MSGFLQRLGTRAIGRAAIVPRAAALFETPAAAPVVMPMLPDVVRVTRGVPNPAPPRASARAFDPEGPWRNAAIPRDARATEFATPHTPPRRVGDMEPSATQVRTDERRPHEHNAHPAHPDTLRAAAPIEETRREQVSMLARVAQPAVATPALVAARALPAPRGTALARPNVAPPMRATDAIEPVRVTIGRVEVRAVFEQAAARPIARTALPSPSLDEYLHKRGRS